MTNRIVYDENFMKLINERQFDDNFLNSEWPKLHQAAEVHGYRGASKKKHNGIVPIRPSDTGLLKTLKRLTKSEKNISNAIPIKVVAHVPSGNRLVGYRFSDGSISIYGLANYDD